MEIKENLKRLTEICFNIDDTVSDRELEYLYDELIFVKHYIQQYLTDKHSELNGQVEFLKFLEKDLYSLTTQLENLLESEPYNDADHSFDNIIMDLLGETKVMEWDIFYYWHDKFVKTKKLSIDKIYQNCMIIAEYLMKMNRCSKHSANVK